MKDESIASVAVSIIIYIWEYSIYSKVFLVLLFAVFFYYIVKERKKYSGFISHKEKI